MLKDIIATTRLPVGLVSDVIRGWANVARKGIPKIAIILNLGNKMEKLFEPVPAFARQGFVYHEDVTCPFPLH